MTINMRLVGAIINNKGVNNIIDRGIGVNFENGRYAKLAVRYGNISALASFTHLGLDLHKYGGYTYIGRCKR